MVFLRTECQSLTGRILYSDCYQERPGMLCDQPEVDRKSFLNRWAAVPLLGCLAGVTRMVLAIIHIVGHLICAAIFREKGHLYHAAKGGTEFVRGLIETIPIVGNIFVWKYDPQMCTRFLRWEYSRYVKTEWCFFIIKITNPTKLDDIDRAAGHV